MTRNIIFVTGESTEIGKTFVACSLIAIARTRGHLVSARKPLQSYATGETTDAALLAQASGEQIDSVNKWSYEIPMAPPMAGAVLGQTVPKTEEVVEFLKGCENSRCFAVIEGVGGPYSPLAANGDSLSLIRHIRPRIILAVINSGLGAINASLLCLNALFAPNIILYYNRFDKDDLLHKMNIDFLKAKLLPDNTPLDYDSSEHRNIYLATDIEQLVETCEKIFSGCHNTKK